MEAYIKKVTASFDRDQGSGGKGGMLKAKDIRVIKRGD